MRTTLIAFVSLCTIASGVLLAADEKIAENKAAEEKAGFVVLFDGGKLSPDIWQGAIDGYPIEDGAIVCRKGGNLLTRKEYANFHLRFEFRLPAGGNNGLGIRAAGDGDAAYNGMELQILDNFASQYATLNPYQYHGSIYGVVPSKRNAEKHDYLKPTGEWNREEVIADGTKIKVILNGEVIVDADLAEFRDKPTPDGHEHPGLFREKGFVGFLGHGDPVAFRNVRIKELKSEKAGH